METELMKSLLLKTLKIYCVTPKTRLKFITVGVYWFLKPETTITKVTVLMESQEAEQP